MRRPFLHELALLSRGEPRKALFVVFSLSLSISPLLFFLLVFLSFSCRLSLPLLLSISSLSPLLPLSLSQLSLPYLPSLYPSISCLA